MKSFFLFICFLVIVNSVDAQSWQSISISYFGETFTHPGLKVGMEHSLWSHTYQKTNRREKQFDKKKQLFLTTNLGGYHHSKFHTALFANCEMGYRKVKKKGFKLEVLLGAGIMRTFLAGNTYEMLDDKEIKKVSAAGQYGFMPSLALGLGRDLSFAREHHWAFHIKPSIYLQMPYNLTILPHFILETGITYMINRKDK